MLALVELADPVEWHVVHPMLSSQDRGHPEQHIKLVSKWVKLRVRM
jgi:hypothetical protein